MEKPPTPNTTIKHKGFHHIINAEVRSYIKKHDINSLATVEEKIDGSNLFFASNGMDAACGSKRDLLNDTAKFYNFQALLHLKKSILELYRKLSVSDVTIYLYGEIIPTQKRIKYVNDGIYFVAFDLKVVPFGQEEDDTIKSTWMARDKWAPVATECGFIVNPILLRGTLEECLKYDVENSKSIIPKLLDKNSTLVSIIEGVVIKGDGFTVKKKASAFREMETGGGVKFVKTTDPNETAVGELIGSMLTESRLSNIVSQIGSDMQPDAPRLANTVVLDAIEEAKDDEKSVIYKISKNKVSKIQRVLAADFVDTVKKYMNWI